MTRKSTREENVQAVFDLKAGYTLGLADVEILKRVARMALAAMDSEAVAEITEDLGRLFVKIHYPTTLKAGDNLYHHAQPAPVVPDEMLCDFYEVNNWTDLVRELVKHVEQLQDSARRNVKPWEDTFPETLLPAYIERIKHADEACRAAMLQAQSDDDGEPTDDERIIAIEGIHNCERCGDEGLVVDEMGIMRFAWGQDGTLINEGTIQAGNSPVITDSARDAVRSVLAAAPHETPALNSVQSGVTVPGKWILVSEQKPDCWCLTCRPVTLNDMRFVVCPDCGNKRLPRANDHRNACTGNNEPGHEGSAYPDTPQEEK